MRPPADLPLEEVEIETPVAPAKAKRWRARSWRCVPIHRRAWACGWHGSHDPLLQGWGNIGLYRDPETLEPVDVLLQAPRRHSERDVYVVDPMFATGGRASAACSFLKKHGCKHIKLMCIPGRAPAWERMQKTTRMWTFTWRAMDEKLNESRLYRPRLGDAGDRIFGTK
jgi:uracil phosphoribosyltransferase